MTFDNHWEDFLEAPNASINEENSSSYFDNYRRAIPRQRQSTGHGLYADMFLAHDPDQEGSDSPEKDDSSYEDQFLGRGREGRPVKDVEKDAETEKGPSPEESSQQKAEIKNRLREIRSSFRQRDLPRLSKQAERQLSSNSMQISLVEGNLFSLKERCKTIYMTSSFLGEGKTTAAVNMAYALAGYGGKDTLLLDCNFLSPQIHRLFKAPNTIGLRNVFFQDIDITEAILPTLYDHLYIVTSGNKPLIESVTVEEDRLQKILKELTHTFEYVIFDGRSILSSSEPAFFARFFDSLILVVECEKTKWEVAQIAIKKILNAKGKIMGVVLNKRKFYIPTVIYRNI